MHSPCSPIKKLRSCRGSKFFMFITVSSRSNHYIRTLAGNLALARRPERTDIPLGLLISRVQRGVLASFHFAVACGNSINSSAVTAVFFTFHCPCFPASSILASRRLFLIAVSSNQSSAELQEWCSQNTQHLRRWLQRGINREVRRPLYLACPK